MASSIICDFHTENQNKAIEHFKGPLLIIAGPGTGKTRVITHRVAYLIKEKGIKPENILVTTFTNKAADQLKDRIEKLIGEDVESMQISTIHSFCKTLLDEYHDKHEYWRCFEVLDEDGQFLFIRANRYNLGLGKFLNRGHLGKFLRKLMNTFNLATENEVDPDAYIEYIEKNWKDRKNYEELLAVAEAYKIYLELLKKEKLIDFARLQMEVLNLLNDEEVLSKVKERYKFLLIDEYQDTNPIQAKIFRKIANPENNICVVGDEDQSIYRFRGATVKNFLKFEREYKAKVIKLEENFRSTEEIVRITNSLIEKNERRVDKNLISKRRAGNKVVLVREDSAAEEADAVANLIKEMKNKKIIGDYADVAVLFRSVKYHAKEYLRSFKENKIPFVVMGDGGFLDRSEIRNMQYLINFVGREKWRENKFQKWDWWSPDMFTGEVLSLSAETAESIENLPQDIDICELKSEKDFNEIGIKNKKDIEKLQRLLEIKRKFSAKKYYKVLDLFYDILESSEYLKRLYEKSKEGDKQSEETIYNLAKLSRIISNFDRYSTGKKVEDFLWYMYHLPDKSIDEAKIEVPNAVKIMTIHQAKGLEFPVVIVGSVIQGRFPNPRPRDHEKFPIPEELLKEQEIEKDIEIVDQRRLFYVGLSRSQDNLIIGTAEKVNVRRMGPSIYLKDIGMDNLSNPEALRIKCEKSCGEEQPKKRLSYSAISTYLSCPLRYKFLYVYEFQTPAWYLQNYGASIHRTLESIHKLALDGIEIDASVIEQELNKNWVPFRYADEEREQEWKSKAFNLIKRYVENFNERFQRIEDVEKYFAYSTENYVLTGEIDLLCRTKDGKSFEIVDFKTRAVKGLQIMHAKLQLNLYALALSKNNNIGNLVVHMLEDNKIKNFDWNKKVEEETKRIIEITCDSIKNERFEPKKNYFCGECEFKFVCPLWEVK